jgi:hypothetical protein
MILKNLQSAPDVIISERKNITLKTPVRRELYQQQLIDRYQRPTRDVILEERRLLRPYMDDSDSESSEYIPSE